MSDALRVLSLGAGVQSSSLALMMVRGEIAAPHFAVFADTQAEPASVYAWLDWLRGQLTFPLHVVTKGDLAKAAVEIRTSRKSGKTYMRGLVPFWLADGSGGKAPPARRACTLDYKVTPIHRFVRLELRARGMKRAQMVMGISRDEAHRMKEPRVKWTSHDYPLVDGGLTRLDCLMWMERNGYPKPPRSACTFCPYHNNEEWLRLQRDEPEAFASALAFESAVQDAATRQVALRGKPFLHQSLKPLGSVDFSPKRDPQTNLFGNECEGMCGV